MYKVYRLANSSIRNITAQVETLLKNQDSNSHEPVSDADPTVYIANRDTGLSAMKTAHDRVEHAFMASTDPFLDLGNHTMPMGDSSDASMENIALGWDMISLGVEEALPAPEVQEHLYVDANRDLPLPEYRSY